MRTESLSFTLRRADSHQDLLRACRVRADAYGYKVPAYRDSMAEPDAIDASPWTTVFLCEDKSTGNCVGTMRVQTRTHGRGELELERYVTLPAHVQRLNCSEVTRLSAPIGVDPFVRLALWKAAYLFSLANNVSWIVMTVRKPALIKAYERMGSKDLFTDNTEGFCLPYVGALPHRIYGLDIDNFYSFWSDSHHPLLAFMTATRHDDIELVDPSVERGAHPLLVLPVSQGPGVLVERVGLVADHG
ncbi:MAG: hypothetical protein ABI330_01895 [Caldimonas sp.]